LAACLALFSVNLDRMPLQDEMHHVLAGQSMAATGKPRIAEGVYTRGLLYTWLVAQSFKLFGVSLAAARVPSLVCMALLVPLLFVWLRREAGSVAAWIGAGLFLVSPFTVEVAQFSRFYAPQTLALFVGAVLVYEALKRPARFGRLAALLAVALPFLGLAIYLQPTTLLGLAGLGLWAAGAVLLPWLSDPTVRRARKWQALAGLALLATLALLGLRATGTLQDLWQTYRSVPVFNLRSRNDFWYYHAWYMLLYPTLWTLTGVVGVAAAARSPRPGWFLLVTFAVSFVLTSFGGPKGVRYLAYAQPFLFALWGVGLAALAGPLGRFVAGLREQLAAGMTAVHGGGRERLATLALGLALLSVVAVNPFLLRTVTLVAEIPLPTENPTARWPAAEAALRPWLDRAEVVVTTEELGTLFFLGRYDIRFSPSKLGEQPRGSRHEFGRDFRTGRPIIGTNESMQLVLDCFASGLVLGPIVDWGKPHLINRELAGIIAARAQPVELPQGSHMFAYAWARERPARDGQGCAAARAAVRRLP
jgi:hypothetical protein